MIKLNIGINYYCKASNIIIGISGDYSTSHDVFMSEDCELIDGTIYSDLEELPVKVYKQLEEFGYLEEPLFGDDERKNIYPFKCKRGYFVIATKESCYYSITIESKKISFNKIDKGELNVEQKNTWAPKKS